LVGFDFQGVGDGLGVEEGAGAEEVAIDRGFAAIFD
jgi:hypothetical protein